MREVVFFIGFFFASLSAIAQPYTSRLGRFQVDQIRGCAPFTINITDTNLTGNGGCTGTSPCVMSFDGTTNCPPNANCQNVIQFTYNTPGTYKLTVAYQNIGADDITVTVDPNIQPPFDIYTCAGDQVSINITDKTYDSYSIFFNNTGTPDVVIPSGNNQKANYSYGAGGSKTIRVQGKKLNAANNCNAMSHTFSALTTLPSPIINSLTATDASTFQLAFTPQSNIEYKSEIAFNNSSNFQVYQTLYGTNSMTASNLNVDANYYCFRLSSYDPCANTNIYSIPVCSQKFNLTLASGSDQLAWQTSSSGISDIKVIRNSNTLATLAGTDVSFTDNVVTCKTNYCYQLVSDYPGGITSTSLQKCGTAFSTISPTSINNTSAVVNGNQVDLTWIQDPAFASSNYNISKSNLGGSFQFQGASTTTKYTDDSYEPGAYCYEVDYVDKCDNKSGLGLPSCPINLNGNLDQSNNVTLNWSGYHGWNQGVKTYSVQQYFKPGQSGPVIYSGPDSTYIDQQQDPTHQVVYYKVTADANEAGVTSSVSNEIKIVKRVNLFHPTAFNPESSYSVNQTFNVKGHYVSTLTLQIFDRWGSLVFFSDKDKSWDGKKDGVAMPAATYVWTADGTDLLGNTFKNGGVVVLIRKP